MDFKVTSIDEAAVNTAPETVVEETTQTPVDNVQEQDKTQVTTEATAEVKDEVKTETTDEPQFEVTSVDYDKETVVKEPVPTATVEHDNIQTFDLRTFMTDNKDLINDFSKLDRDYSTEKSEDLVKLHLKDAHPNLDDSDIKTLLEDYKFNEEEDDRAEIVRKKLALDKASTEARSYLEGKKTDFFNQLGERRLGGPSPEEKAAAEKLAASQQLFAEATGKVFNSEFESFEFDMSDSKRLKLKINNVDAVKTQQSDLNNFVGKYIDLNTNDFKDVEGYHKALFVAMNYESMLKNAYQQGQSDAITAETQQAKNISMDAREQHTAETNKVSWKLVD